MLRIVITTFITLIALTGTTAAQSRDPWAGYEVRDIRDLRDEAAARRGRLRDLARDQHQQRAKPQVIELEEGLGKRKRDVAIPVQKRGSEAPKTKPIRSVSSVDAKRPVARPAPAWKGPGLLNTADERGSYLRQLTNARYHTGAMPIYDASLTKEGILMKRDGLRAEVSVSRQSMRLMEGGEVVAEWPVSTGRKGYESTRGEFGVSFLSRNHKSSLYNGAPMPCSIFYNGGEAIHGTSSVNRLGSKASHGCVRLETRNACALYDMVAERGKGSLRVVVSD